MLRLLYLKVLGWSNKITWQGSHGQPCESLLVGRHQSVLHPPSTFSSTCTEAINDLQATTNLPTAPCWQEKHPLLCLPEATPTHPKALQTISCVVFRKQIRFSIGRQAVFKNFFGICVLKVHECLNFCLLKKLSQINQNCFLVRFYPTIMI
jgi:hypothetical protein